MQEKVLVLDIDGTLTNSKKEITEATKQGIWNILQHGHKVILASGRPTPGMRKCEEELELKKYGGYLLSFNGARIVECKTGEVVYQRTLPLSIVPGLYEFAKANGCGLITYQGPGVISAFEPDDYVQLEARINGIPIKIVDNFVEYVNFDINKCLMTAPEEIAPELEKQLQEKYSDVASIYRSEPYFLELVPLGIDKAQSLTVLLEKLDMKREEMVAVGDGYNDLSMIKFAGLGVAMANAQEPVKKAADYITLSNDEDGVAAVVERYFSAAK